MSLLQQSSETITPPPGAADPGLTAGLGKKTGYGSPSSGAPSWKVFPKWMKKVPKLLLFKKTTDVNLPRNYDEPKGHFHTYAVKSSV